MPIQAGDILWKIGADSKGFERAMASASRSAKDISKSFAANSKAIGIGMTAIGGAIVGALGMAGKAAMNFGTSMAAVNTLGVKNLKAIEETVKDVAARFGQDLTGAAEAAYQAISAGASEAELPRILEAAAKAAAAGMTDLTTSIELGMGTLNAFGGELKSIDEVFDLAFIAVNRGVTTFEELSASVGKATPLFKAAGSSAADMFASIAALTKVNIGTAEATTAMSAVMKEVIKPTDQLTKAFEDVGGPMAVIKESGLAGFLERITEVTGGSTEAIGQLFGSSEALVAILSLTGSAAGFFNENLTEMNSGVAATDEAFAKLVESDPGFAFRMLKSEMQVLMVEIGQALLPVLRKVLQVVTPIIQKIRAWIKNNQELTQKIVLWVGAIGGIMVVVGPLIVGLGALMAAFTVIGPVVGGVIAAFVAGALLLAATWGFVGDAVTAVWRGLGNIVFEIGNAIGRSIGGMVNAIRGLLHWLGQLGPRARKFLGFASGGVIPGFAQGGTIPGFASGGVGMSRIVEVGERGPELAALPIGTRVLSTGQAKQAVSAGVTQSRASASGGFAGDQNYTVGPPLIGNLTLLGDISERDADRIVERINSAQARAYAKAKG